MPFSSPFLYTSSSTAPIFLCSPSSTPPIFPCPPPIFLLSLGFDHRTKSAVPELNVESRGFGDVTDFEFKRNLNTEFGDILPSEIQCGICDIVEKHHQDKSGNCDVKAEILVMDVLHYLSNHSYSEFFLGAENFDTVVKTYRKRNISDSHIEVCGAPFNDGYIASGHFDFKNHHISTSIPHRKLASAFDSVADDNIAKAVYDTPSGANRSMPFHISNMQKRFYYIICKMGLNKFKDRLAINISGVRCTFQCLSASLQPLGQVDALVVAAYCAKLFHELHAASSKKYFFGPQVGELMFKVFSDSDAALLKETFQYAISMDLHLCDMLYFPICFKDHWFLFIVNMKESKFVFLDSLYKKDSDYALHVSKILVQAFKILWSHFFRDPMMSFDLYETIYPPTPFQKEVNDSGVFIMMFMHFCKSTSIFIPSLLSHEDIPRIRISLVNDLFFSPFNNIDKTIVESIHNQISAAADARRSMSQTIGH
ncbi:hypothetical protein ACP70R_008658 [Stipagrostis hirtigluma subsp. patula]